MADRQVPETRKRFIPRNDTTPQQFPSFHDGRNRRDEARTYGQTNISGTGVAQLGDQIFYGPVHFTGSKARPDSDTIAAHILLESLSFDSMDSRFRDIPPAHNGTYSWAFTSHDDPLSPYGAFHAWLREPQSPLFWIKGKPGVGKSTLTRLLSSSALTRQCLTERIGTLKLIIAKCFLWSPGSEFQHSICGLLRSLLYDILDQCMDLCPAACPRRWSLIKADFDTDEAWSEPELLSALHKAISRSQGSCFLLMFVDGLDEYEGSHHKRIELNELVKTIAEYPHVKVCTTSRPWPVFADAFKSCPKLQLDDLTRPDITKFVHDKFYESEAYQLFERLSPQAATAIVDDVVRKSEGVFLWVSLVTEELLQALQEGHTLSELNRKLHEIPPDLNAYLRRIVSGIKVEHWAQASTLFLAVLNSNTRYLSTFSFIEEEGLNLDAWPRTSDDKVLHAKEELLIRMIETRCQGLLQTQTHATCGKLYRQKVDFLHRTVRDFLLSSEIYTILHQHAFDEFQSANYALDALTVQLRTATTLESHDLIDVIACYLEQLQMEKQFTQTPSLQARLDVLRQILDNDTFDRGAISECDTVPHSLRACATVASWQAHSSSLDPLLHLYGLSALDSAKDEIHQEKEVWPLTCPFAVHARLECWSGRGPCLCYTLHRPSFSTCFQWHHVRTWYLKDHLIRHHIFTEYTCTRCGLDCKSHSTHLEHTRMNPPCQIVGHEKSWKMSLADEDALCLRRPRPVRLDRSEYWFMVYRHLFPGSPLPLSPRDIHLWRHKPGTGGTEYVRDFDAFKDPDRSRIPELSGGTSEVDARPSAPP